MPNPTEAKLEVDETSVRRVEERDPHSRFRIVRDATINYSATALSGMVGLVMVPILLHGLGAEGYGLWIAALMVGTLVPLDLGLGWSLVREIAAAKESPREATIRFVATTGNLFIGLGLAGAIAIATLGLPLSRGLHLSAESRQLAPWVFCFAGISFFGDHMMSYVVGVFHGLRRFDAANLVSISGVLLRAIGSITLLYGGRKLIAVALWQAIVPLLLVIVGLFWISNIQPQYRLWSRKTGIYDFSIIRSHLSFGIASQLTMSATNIVWQSTPFLVSLLRGPAVIIPYYVGQKFPLAVSLFNSKTAEPMFPATSEARNETAEVLRVLEVGTRWSLMISLPLCVLLWVLGPNLLRAWLGDMSSEALLILRVTTAAALADGLGIVALHVLWAIGEVKAILRITLAMALATVLATIGILAWFDAVYAVWALLVPMTVGAFLFLDLATKKCGSSFVAVLKLCSGFTAPTLICAAMAWALSNFIHAEGWFPTIAIAVSAGLSYLITLYLFAGTQDERLFIHSLFSRKQPLSTNSVAVLKPR